MSEAKSAAALSATPASPHEEPPAPETSTRRSKDGVTRTCKAYSVRDRLRVIEKCEQMNWGSLEGGAHFDIDRTTVHGWLKTNDQLRASVQAESTLLIKVRRTGGGRKSKTADIEPAFVEKIKQAYDISPSRQDVLALLHSEYPRVSEAMSTDARRKWVQRFMTRHIFTSLQVDTLSAPEINYKTTDEISESLRIREPASEIVNVEEEKAAVPEDDIMQDDQDAGLDFPSNENLEGFSDDDEDSLVRTIQEYIDTNAERTAHFYDSIVRLVVAHTLEDLTEAAAQKCVRDGISVAVDSAIPMLPPRNNDSSVREPKPKKPKAIHFRSASSISLCDGSPEIVSLDQKDLETLVPGRWINDAVISYFIARYIPQHPDVLNVGCQFYGNLCMYQRQYGSEHKGYQEFSGLTAAVDWLRYKYIQISVNENNHWSFVLLEGLSQQDSSRLGRTVAFHVDSRPGSHDRVSIVRRISDYVQLDLQARFSMSHNGIKRSVSISCEPQQENTFDCGVYVMYYMQKLAKKLSCMDTASVGSSICELCCGLTRNGCATFRKSIYEAINSNN